MLSKPATAAAVAWLCFFTSPASGCRHGINANKPTDKGLGGRNRFSNTKSDPSLGFRDKYSDKAAKQNEIVPLAEIEDMLSSKTQHAEGRSHHQLYPLFRRKAFVFATISLAIILAGSVITLMVHPDETRVDEEIFVPEAQRRVMRLVKNIAARRPNGEIAVSQLGSQAEATTIPIHLRSKFDSRKII